MSGSAKEEKLERQADEIYRRYLESFPKWAIWAWEIMARQAFEELRNRMKTGEITVDRPYFAYYLQTRYEKDRYEAGDWPGPTFWDFVEGMKAGDEALTAERLVDFTSTDFLREATYGVWRTPSENGKYKIIIPELNSNIGERGAVLDAIREHVRSGHGFSPKVRDMTIDFVQEPFRFGTQGLVERFDENTSTAIMKQFLRHFTTSESEGAEEDTPIEQADEEGFLNFLNNPLQFTCPIEDSHETLTITAIVELSPLFVEPEFGRASFPVVVGIEADTEADPVPLANVPPETLEKFWEILFETLDKVRGSEEENELNLMDILSGLFEKIPPPPPAPVRTILDTPTREDALVRARISQLNRIKLPTKWERIPRWEDFVEKRISAIVAEHGEDEAVRKKLLKTKTIRENGESKTRLELSAAEKESLRDSLEGKTFRERRRGPGGGVEYAIVKRKRTADGGVLEIALSWYGMDWKLVEGGRKLAEEAFEGILRKNEERLFPELSSSQVEEVRAEIRHIRFLRDSDRLMAFLVDRFPTLGTNVFRIPLWEVKGLFEIEKDPHALERINGAFYCLQHLKFSSVRSGKRPSEGGYGYAPFLVFYEIPKSPDGDIVVEVSEWAIGALKFFESGRKAYPHPIIEKPEDPKNKPSGEVVSHDFGRVLSTKEKKALGGELKKQKTRISHKPTSSNAHFVNALADGDDKRKDKLLRLLDFLASELTRRKDPRRDKRREIIAKPGSPEAELPRLYDRTFCPLLEDKVLAGALGHHKHNAESGRRLYGGAPQATAKSGAFPEGLLSLLGFHETTKAGRARAIREAILLMAEVVETKLEGLVAIRTKDAWLRIPEAIENEAGISAVGREARVCLFVPGDYVDRLHTIYNEYAERRARKEDLPYVAKITRDRALHERNDLERPSKTPIVEQEIVIETTATLRKFIEDTVPLHVRLADNRYARRLTQKEVGEIFGVSERTVKFWEAYERDEFGKTTKGRPIPKQIIPLLERWLREEIPPTKEELETLTKRRTGRAKD